MNRSQFLIARSLIVVLLLSTVVVSAQGAEPLVTQAALGAGFTYQGQLINETTGEPAVGTFDFQFALFDSSTGGAQIGNIQSETITLSGGLFTVRLNDAGQFGLTAFTGEARYLEIRVSEDGGANYTTLAPRQPLTAAPYAHSLRPGATISGTLDAAAVLNLSNNGANGVGLFVDQATGEGVTVGSANNGVFVASATTNGVVVGSAANGVYIVSASQDGLFVCATGSNTGCTTNDAIHNGVEVGNAEGYGLWVNNAGSDGVMVVKAGDDGLQVAAAGDDGLDITAADDGVLVRTVGGNGVHVESPTGNGVQVDSGFIGVNVKNTTATGVIVSSPGGSGLLVSNAGGYGVRVISATDFAGSFNGNVEITGTCTGCTLAMFAVNSGDSPLQPGDVVALQGTRSGDSIGQPLLMEVSQAQAGAPVVGVVYGHGELVETEGPDGQMVTHLAPREGIAQAGDYVHIVIYGPMQVKASAFGSAIQIGDKLAIDNSGAARSLQTRELDGMRITESAPTIGIALEGLEASKDGLIWVLVNPQ